MASSLSDLETAFIIDECLHRCPDKKRMNMRKALNVCVATEKGSSQKSVGKNGPI